MDPGLVNDGIDVLGNGNADLPAIVWRGSRAVLYEAHQQRSSGSYVRVNCGDICRDDEVPNCDDAMPVSFRCALGDHPRRA